jgi:molecular chaperone DnaK (HSP70)
VRENEGDNKIGGEDFENRMVKNLEEELKRKLKKEVCGNKRELSSIRKEEEREKSNL